MMFAMHDMHSIPGAPAIKVPTLSAPLHGSRSMQTKAYSPSMSLRRYLTSAAPAVGAVAPSPPAAELVVHECTPVTSKKPSSSWRAGEDAVAADPFSRNEFLKQAEEGWANESAREVRPLTPRTDADTAATTRTKSPHPTETPLRAAGKGGLDMLGGDELLQTDEFVEGLLRHVRASCAGIDTVEDGDARREKGERLDRNDHPHSSPHPSLPPRRPPSPTAAGVVDATTGDRSTVDRRLGKPSRSPSPSPSPSLSTELDRARLSTATGERCSRAATTMADAYRERDADSPDPHPPATDLYAVGGVLRSSLQHSRCSGVSRGRRSLSIERPEVHDSWPHSSNAPLEKEDFWARAAALRVGSMGVTEGRPPSSERSPSPSMCNTHPRWAPHPLNGPRPAWNQRQPPKKQRPVVSMPGSQPPTSARRCASHTPEPHRGTVVKCSMSEESGAIGGASRAVDWATRRPTPRASPQTSQSQPSVPLHRTRSPSPAPTVSPAALPASDAVSTIRTSLPSKAANTSPLCPPSARVLFQSHDPETLACASPPPPTSPMPAKEQTTLEGQCSAALERAARAEHLCSVLSHALEQLLLDHAADKAAWEHRQAQMEQRLDKMAAWIAPVDAEANHIVQAAESSVAPAASTETPDAVASHEEEAVVVRGLTSKRGTWDDVGADGVSTSSQSGAPPSVEGSPLPGAPGTTPTPARRHSTGGESGSTSMRQVRVPPSPPLILHMHES